MTCEVPLSQLPVNIFYDAVVNNGVRPERLDPSAHALSSAAISIPDSLWKICEQTWLDDPRSRPSASNLCALLGGFESERDQLDEGMSQFPEVIPSTLAQEAHAKADNHPSLLTGGYAHQKHSEQEKEESLYTQKTLRLKGHSDEVSSVAFSWDGKRVVSGSVDKTVRIWNLETEVEEKRLKGHSNPVCSVAISLDGRRVVSGSSDDTLRIWNAITGKEEQKLKGHSASVSTVAFSSDGRRVVSGSRDNMICIWNVITGKKEKKLKGH
jgi:hypothetical protein